MVVLDALGAAELCQVITAFRDGLRSHRELINRLNVYPVPDGDTGTNMALTIESVTDEIDGLDSPDLDATCQAIAHGSLMGARGNSGVILSQLLRGISDGLNCSPGRPGAARAVRGPDHRRPAGPRGGDAPGRGHHPDRGPGCGRARPARPPTPGNRWWTWPRRPGRGRPRRWPAPRRSCPCWSRPAWSTPEGPATCCCSTPSSPCSTAGRCPSPPPELPDTVSARSTRRPRALPSPPDADADADAELAGLRYEVMYLLEAPDDTIPSFKEVWAGLGDSIVVVGGDGLWNCHIHTDDIGAAIEASLDAGRPRTIRVTDLLEQVEEERWVREGAGARGAAPRDAARPAPTTGVVAVATGDGIGRIFRSLGVQGLIAGGQSMNPSTAELVEAVDALGSDQVIILPNNGNIRPVAERVDDLTAKSVRVVPTDTIAEGFAALLAYDPEAGVETNAETMEASARKVVPGEVTRAVRDSDSRVGPITAGDWLGLSREGIEVVSDSLAGAACALLEVLMADGHDLVTIIEGEGSGAADTRRITEWISDHRPDVETEVHHGGQPLYPYLFSIE